MKKCIKRDIAAPKACGQGQWGAMQLVGGGRESDLGTEVGGQRSEVGGREMMVGGCRGPGGRGGKKRAAAWE